MDGKRSRMKEKQVQRKVNPWLAMAMALDVSQIFREKGNLRRWSAKRTIGGAIVLEALWQIHENGLSWPGIALCVVGITPLCVSFFERS